jgi:hypothetical protein
MPEGNDFVDDLEAVIAVDAVAEVEDSSEALPAVLLGFRLNKRRIAPSAGYAERAKTLWRCLDGFVGIAVVEKAGVTLADVARH